MNDYGFETRKAILERGRDANILSKYNEQQKNLQPQKGELYKAPSRFENSLKMNNMCKENFNRNFNKK